jgi:hypothetical protein
MGTPKMQYCFNCGAELGVYQHYHGDIEHCGARECAREAQNSYRAEREEAHERLDRDMGWL